MGKDKKVGVWHVAPLLMGIFSLLTLSAHAKKTEVISQIIEKELAPEAVQVAFSYDEDLSNLDEALRGQISAKDLKEATVLRKAYLALQNDDTRQALSLLRSIKDSHFLGEYVRYYYSIALKKLGDEEGALKILPETTSFAKRLDWDVLWHKLDLLALTKNTTLLKKYVAQALTRSSRDKMVKIKASYFLGKGALLAGQKDEAFRNFRAVLVDNAGSEYDDRIFSLLKKQGISRSEVLNEGLLNRRADTLIATGYAYEGRKIYEGLARKNPSEYKERVAYAVFRERRYVEAAYLYSKILKSGIYSSPKLTLLTYLAQAYARHDGFEGAIKTNKDIIAAYPGSAAASTADFKLGFLYFDSGNYKAAIPYLEKYAKNGGYKTRESARWYRFWAHYLSRDYAKALEEAKLFQVSASKDKRLLFTYWIGRIYDGMGKRKEASAYYTKAAGMDRAGYYGLLANQRLRYGKLHPKTLINPELLSHVPEGAIRSKNSKLESLGSKESLTKLVLLYRAGLDNHAFSENQNFVKSYRGSATADFISALQLGGNYYYSYAIKGTALAGRVPGCDTLCGWRTAYPLAYEKYVAPYSRHWGIDDKLAYAVMRQESVFKPEVMSYAYAFGLMQIIPPTGVEIAEKIHYPNFHPSLLNQPKVNTLFGTFYLSYLLNSFERKPILAMAAYNAGPEAVSRWHQKYRNEEADVFVELIPYAQTNDYVKKVLLNYLSYGRLYPSDIL